LLLKRDREVKQGVDGRQVPNSLHWTTLVETQQKRGRAGGKKREKGRGKKRFEGIFLTHKEGEGSKKSVSMGGPADSKKRKRKQFNMVEGRGTNDFCVAVEG